jgi:hypothetical protein
MWGYEPARGLAICSRKCGAQATLAQGQDIRGGYPPPPSDGRTSPRESGRSLSPSGTTDEGPKVMVHDASTGTSPLVRIDPHTRRSPEQGHACCHEAGEPERPAGTRSASGTTRCKGRWSPSWQITPRALITAVTDPDPAAAKRAFDAMMGMTRIDIAVIETARRGWPRHPAAADRGARKRADRHNARSRSPGSGRRGPAACPVTRSNTDRPRAHGIWPAMPHRLFRNGTGMPGPRPPHRTARSR